MPFYRLPDPAHELSRARPSEHHLGFARNAMTGQWRGWCSCGWVDAGPEQQILSGAALHGLEWEPLGQFEVVATRRDQRDGR